MSFNSFISYTDIVLQNWYVQIPFLSRYDIILMFYTA